jgi:hypothetical protein
MALGSPNLKGPEPFLTSSAIIPANVKDLFNFHNQRSGITMGGINKARKL